MSSKPAKIGEANERSTQMSLAEELQKAQTNITMTCKLSRWLGELSEMDRETAKAALNGELTSAAVHRAFKNYGFDGSESVIWKHRNGTKCAKCKDI
jgi:arginine repressor